MTCYVLTACSQALASHDGAALWRQLFLVVLALWADVAQALNLLLEPAGPHPRDFITFNRPLFP